MFAGEQGMVDEAQKALEEAEALKKVFFNLYLSNFNTYYKINCRAIGRLLLTVRLFPEYQI